jgi:DNA-binding transcriptional regulator YdaS (Cro superfamily)
MRAADFDALLKSVGRSDRDLEEFATRLGVTPSIVRDWASGSTAIPADKFARIDVMIELRKRGAALRDTGPGHRESNAQVAEIVDHVPTYAAGLRQHVVYAARGVAFLLRVCAFTALACGIACVFSHTARDVLLPLLWNKIAPGALTVIVATMPSGFVASWTFARLRERTDLARGIAGVVGTYTFIGIIGAAIVVTSGGVPTLSDADLASLDIASIIVFFAQAGVVGTIFGFHTNFDGGALIETAPSPSPPSAELPTPEARQ